MRKAINFWSEWWWAIVYDNQAQKVARAAWQTANHFKDRPSPEQGYTFNLGLNGCCVLWAASKKIERSILILAVL